MLKSISNLPGRKMSARQLRCWGGFAAVVVSVIPVLPEVGPNSAFAQTSIAASTTSSVVPAGIASVSSITPVSSTTTSSSPALAASSTLIASSTVISAVPLVGSPSATFLPGNSVPPPATESETTATVVSARVAQTSAAIIAPLAALASGVVDPVLASDPWGYWKLDDAGSIAVDSRLPTRAAHPGSYGGVIYSSDAPTPWLSGGSHVFPGGACDGVALDAASMRFPDAYSIEAWVKTTSSGGILYRWRPFGTGFYHSGWDLYYNGGANAGVYSPTAPNDGTWHHAGIEPVIFRLAGGE